jgi:trimeric autotransporter adhesin
VSIKTDYFFFPLTSSFTAKSNDMKKGKPLIPAVLFVLLSMSCFGQSVAINSDGSSPDANAILDLKSTTKGILIPRMSSSNRANISNTKGLLVYDTTVNSFWYNNGNGWISLTAATGTTAPGSVNTDSIGVLPGNNIAIGPFTLKNLYPNGTNNAGFGINVMQSDTSGSFNAAFGINALRELSVGNNNTAFGASALYQNSAGNDNTALGCGALQSNIQGNSLTAIGRGADVGSWMLSNATAIGYGAIVDNSNKVRIGNSAVTVIEGQVPFTTPSDGRYKFRIKEDVRGLDFILKLRPVTYQFDVKRFDEQQGVRIGEASQVAYREAAAIRRSGFIAQEVEEAARLTDYDFSGIIRPETPAQHYSLSYESFVVPLVKAVQEQQKIIEKQQAAIEALQEQIDELKHQP